MNRDTIDQVNDHNLNRKPSELLDFLPANAQVLIDIGCRNGSTGYHYKRINPQSFYWGILIDSELSSEITQGLDQITLSSIDQLETIRLELEEQTVDCLIYDGILPQIRNPLKVLQYHTRWLKDQGQVLAYIPNSQYWRNIIDLLQGKSEISIEENIDYSGLTLEAIQKIFWEAGLYIYEIQTRGKKDDQFQNFLQLVEPLRNTLGLDPNRFATQTAAEFYIVRAIKSLQPPRRLLIQTAIMAPTGCDRLRFYPKKKKFLFGNGRFYPMIIT
ncbi:hypothetical protein L2E81_13545 [Planktothrix agardhii 1033]|nr:hypothetical protein [Planktothrix agardhii 1033]